MQKVITEKLILLREAKAKTALFIYKKHVIA